jgi:hypothetical protein
MVSTKIPSKPFTNILDGQTILNQNGHRLSKQMQNSYKTFSSV